MLINSRQPVWLVNAKPSKAHANQDGLMRDRPHLPPAPVSLFSVLYAEKLARPQGTSEACYNLAWLLRVRGSMLDFSARWSLFPLHLFHRTFPLLQGLQLQIPATVYPIPSA